MKTAEREQLDLFRAQLVINKHRLDDALEVQASRHEAISDMLATMAARVLEAKDELAKIEARLNEEIREEGRATKDAVEAKVRRHRDRITAADAFMLATEDHARWAGLLEAWRARGKDLQALARLFGDNYYAMTTNSSEARLDVRLERPSREGRQDYARPGRTRIE